jgi:hypothetical protein
MPQVLNKDILAKAFLSASRKIEQNQIPTRLLQGDTYFYRAFNPAAPHSLLPKPLPGGVVSKMLTFPLLRPGDGLKDRDNRFSGPSYNPNIPSAGGLYCVLQQQALVNEMMHYSGRPRDEAFLDKCVIRMRVMGAMLVADLSPHNATTKKFLQDLAVGTWDSMSDLNDCSVARGIGLAIANSPKLNGLIARTVRESERSPEERGDNLVLFTRPAGSVANVYIDTAYYFGPSGMETFPVEFAIRP